MTLNLSHAPGTEADGIGGRRPPGCCRALCDGEASRPDTGGGELLSCDVAAVVVAVLQDARKASKRKLAKVSRPFHIMRRIVGFVRVGIRTGVGVDAGNGSGVSGAGGKDVEVCTDLRCGEGSSCG